MQKLSCLYENREYTTQEIVDHILAVRAEGYVVGTCPTFREAVTHAPYVTLEQFLKAAEQLHMNPKTVRRQFLITRRFVALMDLVDDGLATEEQKAELDNWTWQDASTKQIARNQ